MELEPEPELFKSKNRNQNHNFSKVASGTGTVKIITVPQRWTKAPIDPEPGPEYRTYITV